MRPNIPLDKAETRAEELRSKIEALTIRYADGQLPRVTISAGLASFPDAGANMMDVLKAADEALYRAKENGRNRIERSDEGRMPHACEEVADKAAAELGAALAEMERQESPAGQPGRKHRHKAA